MITNSLLLPLSLTAFLLLLLLPNLHATPSSRCLDAEAIPSSSTRLLNSHLSHLVSRSTYFSVFSVALDNACPFWDAEPSQCVIRECSVKDCPPSDVPPAWKSNPETSSVDCEQQHALNHVDRSLTGLAALVAQPVWQAADAAAWTVRDDDSRCTYVDLRSNPEQYTGYAGEGSARIWQAVYDENCFTFSSKCRSGICDQDTCKEERVLYRLISGLHASISMHIARRYLYPGNRWAPNVEIYKKRLRPYPERIANLNVAYAVVMRAMSKAASALHPDNYNYVTGNHENDIFTKTALDRIFRLPLLQPGCEHKVFDESDMFIQKNEYLLPEFRNGFRNISMIMDCVGCEKCRLWGKLQFLGLGAALRILFEDDMPKLERNDVIALFNLLHKLSTSVISAGTMEETVKRDARIKAKAGGAIIGLLILLLAYMYSDNQQKPSNQKKMEETTAASVRPSTEDRAEQDTVSELSTTTTEPNSESPWPANGAQNDTDNILSDTSKPENDHGAIRRSERLRKRTPPSPR